MMWTLTRRARDMGIDMPEAAKIPMPELMHWQTFYGMESQPMDLHQPQPTRERQQQSPEVMKALLGTALGGVPVSEYGTPMNG